MIVSLAERMEEALLIGGDTLTHLARGNGALFPVKLADLERFKSINEYDLLIIENEFEEEKGRKYGKEIIFRLRLKMDCIIPILLVDFGAPPRSREQNYFREVLLDPYVCILPRRLLNEKLEEGQNLLALFGHIQSKDERRILYDDLKCTIYREGGYISELRHTLLHDLHNLSGKEKGKIEYLVKKCAQEVDRILKQWKETNSKRQAIQSRFQHCLSLSSLKDIEEELLRIYRSIEPELPAAQEGRAYPTIIHILYVSDSASNQQQLKRVFEQGATLNIKCHFATNKLEALEQLNQQLDITSVLCDYRFWSGEVVGKENGYLILATLKQTFPRKHYAYLTRFNKMRLLKPLGFSHIEAFSKIAVFERDTEEFFRLVRRIIQQESQVIRGKDAWINSTNGVTKTDKIWREMYKKYFVDAKNPDTINDRLGAEAITICQQFTRGEQHIYKELPKTGVRLHRVPKKRASTALLGRLLIRRVFLGLFNYSQLVEQYQELLETSSYQEKTPLEQRFEVIHRLLEGNNPKIDFTDKKVRSNYFSERLRINTKRDYRLTNKQLDQYVTYTEHRWLRTIIAENE